MSQLGSSLTVDLVAKVLPCPCATVFSCMSCTAHSLRHIWCSCQRSSCHLLLLHQLCDHVDVESVEVPVITVLQLFPVACCSLCNASLSRVPCLDDHQFKQEELESVGDLSEVCAQIVLKCLYLARIGGPEILWSVKKLARSVTKWTQAYDRRLARLISYIHYKSDYRQYCHI